MGKGVKSKSGERATGFTKEIIGMALMMFSVLSFLCLVTGEAIFYTVGSAVQGFFLGLFGYLAFPVLVFTAIFGLRLVVGRAIIASDAKRVIILVMLIAFSVMAIVTTALSYNRSLTFAENFSACYGKGGFTLSTTTVAGSLSMLIIATFGKIAGKAGDYILFALLITISLVLLFKNYIGGLINSVSGGKKTAKKPTRKKANKKKEKIVLPPDLEEEIAPESGSFNEEVSHRPSYMVGGDFGVKTKREKNKGGRQIDVFGGDFSFKDGKSRPRTTTSGNYGNKTYGTQYREGLSEQARYIMTPPPFRPETLGQSPMSAADPSVPSGRGSDDYTKGFSTDRGASYSPDRGGFFDSADMRSSRSSEEPRRSDDLRRTDSRRAEGDEPRRAPGFDRSRDISERLNVDRGKQEERSFGEDTRTSRVSDSFTDTEPSLPNMDKIYNPLEHTEEKGFDPTKVARNRGGERVETATSTRTADSRANKDTDGLFGSERVADTSSDRGRSLSDDRYSDTDAFPRDLFNSDAESDDDIPDFGGTSFEASAPKRSSDRAPAPDRSATTDRTAPTRATRAPAYESDRSTTDTRVPKSFGTDPSDLPKRTSQEDKPTQSQPENEGFISATEAALAQFADIDDEEKVYPSIKEMPIDFNYKKPPLNLLTDYEINKEVVLAERNRLKELAVVVQENFLKRGITIRLENIVYGMAVTRFDYSIPTTVPVKSVISAQADIAIWLHAKGAIRIISPVPGTSFIGIEVPNNVRSKVGLKELLNSPQAKNLPNEEIYIVAGKNIMAEPVFLNLTAMPHLLVAGATGTGKSVFLNALLLGLVYTYSPQDLRIVIVDPKTLEFVDFSGLPHLLFNKIITEADEAAALLAYLVKEMGSRYKLFAAARVKKISEYNEKAKKLNMPKLPYIIVLIDEFNELMMKNPAAKKDIDESITRLAQLARAAGISLIFATQRPTTDVIDGTIKNNFPARICFRTFDITNSQVVLGENGAEKLLGKGDMLYKVTGAAERAQGALVEQSEVIAAVNYVRAKNKCYYDNELCELIKKTAKNRSQESSSEGVQMSMGIDSDPSAVPDVFKKAIRIVIMYQVTSKSTLQTKLGIGYNKAARIIEWMEKQGYISPPLDNKQREIRITRESYEDIFKEPFDDNIDF